MTCSAVTAELDMYAYMQMQLLPFLSIFLSESETSLKN